MQSAQPLYCVGQPVPSEQGRLGTKVRNTSELFYRSHESSVPPGVLQKPQTTPRGKAHRQREGRGHRVFLWRPHRTVTQRSLISAAQLLRVRPGPGKRAPNRKAETYFATFTRVYRPISEAKSPEDNGTRTTSPREAGFLSIYTQTPSSATEPTGSRSWTQAATFLPKNLPAPFPRCACVTQRNLEPRSNVLLGPNK